MVKQSIHSAIEGYCSVHTMQRLIDDGANVNAINNRGLTALLKACAYRQMDVVKVLLDSGADPAIADKIGYSSLHAAVDGRCSLDTLQALINHGAYIDAKRKDGTNALLRACNTGQSESVLFLLQAGADVNIVKLDGKTILYHAVHGKCSKEALQKIIQSGVSVDAANNKGETALICACYTAQAEAVKCLLENGADPNISDPEGYTSLHAAVRGRCINETLQEIIKHNAYLDAQNKNDQTALLLACLYKQQDSVQILLKAGSSTNIPDNVGDRSLTAAVLGGCRNKIIQTIIHHGSDVNATSKRKVTALMTACQMSNSNVINVLLNAGANPNIVDVDGFTCLHYAVHYGFSKEVFQAIIDHRADVNATNKDNRTALMMACDDNNEGIINVLLNAGANPNIVDVDGYTCLHYAAYGECSKDVLETIISQGVDVNATNKHKLTALRMACQRVNTDAINIRLNARADPNITDKLGATCIHHAVGKGCSKDVLEKIINHDRDVNVGNKSDITASMVACRKGNKDVINVLLNAGADPNITSENGDTCLHDAVKNGSSKEVLQAIIDHSADLNATNKKNETALMLACGEGNKDVIDILLNSGADVNAKSKNNMTGLMIACCKGNKDVINVLLNAGADPNIASDNGDTCLHYAALNNHCTEVLQAIINHGIDVNATDKQAVTALMIACSMGNTYAIDILLKSGADVKATSKKKLTALLLASHMGNTDAIDMLLHSGADVNAASKTKLTALMLACHVGNTDAIDILLNSGADVNAKNKTNMTALMIACHRRNTDAINMLLKAGADPNIADNKGAICIHHAVGKGCSKNVLDQIINHGTDVNVLNKNNTTALMLACKKGNKDVINVLLNAGADPNIANIHGGTCLHYAAQNNCCTEIFQAIISHGVDVNVTDKNNVTALMLACKKGNNDAINALLNAGADPIIDSGDDDTNVCCGGWCNNLPLQAIVQWINPTQRQDIVIQDTASRVNRPYYRVSFAAD